MEGIHGGGRGGGVGVGMDGFGRGREGGAEGAGRSGQGVGRGGMQVKRVGFGLWLREKEEICWVSTRKRLAFILLSSRDLDPLRGASLLPAPGTGGTAQPP